MFLNNQLFVMTWLPCNISLRRVFLRVLLPECRCSQLLVQRTLHLRFFFFFFHISGFTGLSGEDTLCSVVTHCLNNCQPSSMTAQRQESSLALLQLDEHPSHFLLASDPVQGHSGAGEHHGWVDSVT